MRKAALSITANDTLKARRTLEVGGKEYDYFNLELAADTAGLGDIGQLTCSLKVAAGEPCPGSRTIAQ